MNLCVIQARMGSSRLPGKVLKKINGKPLLGILLDRISKAKTLDEVILATTTLKEDDVLEDFCNSVAIRCFRGSEKDVLDRYYGAIKHFKIIPDAVVRITSDCPLHHAEVVDFAVEEFLKRKVDYFSNSNQPPMLEDGFDTEVFTFSALERAWREAKKNSEREHVTPFIKNSGYFKCEFRKFISGYNFKLSVDTENDFLLVEEIFKHFYPDENFNVSQLTEFLNRNPGILAINRGSIINEGYKKSLEKD